MRIMKTQIYLLLIFFCYSFIVEAQYIPNQEDLFVNDIDGSDTISTLLRSSRVGSSEVYYRNLNTWIPYANLAPNDPLKNPPITTIELSFHVFLDDNGDHNAYTNTTEGRNRLLWLLNRVNEIYSGNNGVGSSDPIAGVVELPDYDTRIRVSLGDNNERIYFYNNTSLNEQAASATPFLNFIQTNYPERSEKLNVFFTAGYYLASVRQSNIVIDNMGSGYTSHPTITFIPSGSYSMNATATDSIVNGQLVAIKVTSGGQYYDTTPPQIIISGGGGSGAVAHVTTLYGGASGYANLGSTIVSAIDRIVMCHCHLDDYPDYQHGMTLAHELAHTLYLKHTFDNSLCNTASTEYLSDVFGPANNTLCPHINLWHDPFDNTIPNAARNTNNLMSYSPGQAYISPQQAGIMHRSLALYSTRKYVKKETYSPIPLVIDTNQIWDFNLKLYRNIEINSGAVLTLASTFDFPYNGTITVHNGAALVIEKNVNLSNNNKIVVETGGAIQFISGSSTKITSNGYIEIQRGAYICIQTGSTINLQDAQCSIKLKSGYITGVNSNLLPASACVASPANYAILGNGRIKDYSNDLYIQNQTITTNQYFAGKNIYVGHHVTNTLSQGNVLITNNANVIFDAAENVVFEPDFECALGATFEVVK
ncbi:hypothetical protein FACS189463_0210 [Bacteroidia bacterium]|nr:hypothetical protein FACS189463_0210 [Bacteroidia bacterium]